MRLTSEHHARIELLVALGFRASAIARRIGATPGGVQYFMYEAGLASAVRHDARRYVRCGQLVETFSLEEDELLISMRRDGHSCREIAERVNARFGTRRTRKHIRRRLARLAGTEE